MHSPQPIALAVLLAAACTGPGPEDTGFDPPRNTDPCAEREEHWPGSLRSDDYPILVHHPAGREDTAAEVLGHLETAWRVEVEELGFTAPLPDDGACGPDGDFDVFLWPGMVSSYVLAFAEHPETSWDDRLVYMVVDPDGPYGGELLDATIAHEFNHACQAADDWWEATPAFEMTATFMEEVVFDEDDTWKALLEDFQSRPDWALDRNDDYETWYMYAAALYLHYLRERHYDGDASFAAEMWRASRNPPGADVDPSLNEPDFEDALDDLLRRDAGVGFLDSVAGFARWRWYTGSRDDGAHFAEGASFPEVPLAATVGVDDSPVVIDPAPMFLGNAYVRVSEAGASSFELSLESDATDVAWVVQAVPGLEEGSDGEVVDLSEGPARVALADGERVLILTALPAGAYDPDERPETRHPVTLGLAP